MRYLHAREPSRAPAAPPGLVASRVRFGDGLEAARTEWFLKETEQTLFAVSTSAACEGELARCAHITAPATGTIVALDPDIPPKRQRLAFSAQGSGRWLVDGKEIGRGAQAQWLPWPGRHVVQLAGPRGEVLDEIRIEVRGAGVRAASQKQVTGVRYQPR
jgi:penicillin-binding protein 1C